MPAPHRHLDHLLEILSNSGTLPQGKALSEQTLSDFFKSIAFHRIRIGRTDWKGHRVPALLWRFPDLKPDIQVALSRHVVDRWGIQADCMTAPHAHTSTGEEISSRSLPTVVRKRNTEQAVVEENKSNPMTPEQHPFSPEISRPGRDWFDRLTDWVAAVVTLWR
jgi:hypothetical protein